MYEKQLKIYEKQFLLSTVITPQASWLLHQYVIFGWQCRVCNNIFGNLWMCAHCCRDALSPYSGVLQSAEVKLCWKLHLKHVYKVLERKTWEKVKGMSTNGIHALIAVNHFSLSPHPVCTFHSRHVFCTEPQAGWALRSVTWHTLWEARWSLW